jgi:TMEM175 potassium channel family protein
MKPDRLNAFTDGVIAIIITIMVLEIRVPVAGGLAALAPVLPLLAAYALSFVNVGIFWSNHHHMLQSVKKVNGAVLWANLALLFWLSLIPFVIRWIDEAGVTAWPVAAYGLVLVMAALSYLVLERALIAAEGEDSKVGIAIGSRFKEWLSFALYSIGLAAAFLVSPYVSVVLYVAVAVTWLVPDRRFERPQARIP